MATSVTCTFSGCSHEFEVVVRTSYPDTDQPPGGVHLAQELADAIGAEVGFVGSGTGSLSDWDGKAKTIVNIDHYRFNNPAGDDGKETSEVYAKVVRAVGKIWVKTGHQIVVEHE